jgi:hypothetical protein
MGFRYLQDKLSILTTEAFSPSLMDKQQSWVSRRVQRCSRIPVYCALLHQTIYRVGKKFLARLRSRSLVKTQ